MGERNYIKLLNDNILLYAHWDTKELLIKKLKNALIRGKSRWTDRQYLNRIIFSEIVKDDIEGTTNYGLSSDLWDGQIVLEVDIENRKVNGVSFEEFIK